MQKVVETGSEDGETLPPEHADAPAASGEVVGGKYRIETEIGRGGMGRVYAATHLATGKAVALKWLLAKRADDERAMKRLLREARMAAIDHPNLVRVVEVGRHGAATFLVMELLRGKPLRALVGERPVPAAELIATLMPALRGIHAANKKGIVHRDLKPENIFVCMDAEGRHRETKVLDFGISKPFDDRTELTTLTGSGAIVGTPQYMSPEQIRGDQDLDARTDVYAIGVILYEGLTGQRPFQARTITALAVDMATGPLRRPSTLVDIDPRLETVVMRALARETIVRFQDIASLARALEPFAPKGVYFSADEAPQEKEHARVEQERVAERAARASTLRWALPLCALVFCVVVAGWLAAGYREPPRSVRRPVVVERAPLPQTPAPTPVPLHEDPIVEAAAPTPASAMPRRRARRASRASPDPVSTEAPAPRRAAGVQTEGVGADEF